MSAPGRVLLHVSYDGSAYSGFARQENAPTVCGRLEAAIASIDPKAGPLTCSSRTDRGVHARNHPVSFDTHQSLTMRGWALALSHRLPADISVSRAASIESNFDPRRAPLWKSYCYRFYRSQIDDPFLGRTSWRLGYQLDIAAMKKEARSLIGTHDFCAFRSSEDERTETERTIFDVSLEPDASYPQQWGIWVRGNRFLHNMVRIISGTIVDVGRGKLAPGASLRALSSKSRQDLGMTAPAHGLTLERVELPDWGKDAWPPSILP